MGLVYVKRSWLAPSGYDGEGWTGPQVTRFEALMRRHARTVRNQRGQKAAKGMPMLVSAWDDGRGCLCWYTARAGAAERALYQRCVAIFGCAATPEAVVDAS